MEFYNKETELVLEELQATVEGLTEQEVKERQERDGFNELKSKDKVPTWKILLDTFKDPMVIVLLIVTIVQLALGEVVEACIILGVVLISSIVTVIQTKKAESSLDALKQISAPHAKVLRNGEKITIPARELVVGDLVLLEAGDFVPADGRVLTCKSLRVEEGMLTGESEAVEKTDVALEGELPLGDRKNMLYSGALTVYGRGEFIVTGTGSQTEIGKIATLLETAEDKQTPLQQKLEKFSKQLGIAILILSVAIFAIQAARIFFAGDGANIEVKMLDAFMFAVAVAVAAIPEALSSIVTIVLSVGTNKMAKQHAIIRKLPAVETLGSTSVICTDKTGTLTQNKMTVVDYFLPTTKKESFPDQPETWTMDEALLIEAAVLCNDSSINEEGQELGDPTEVALIAFSNKVGKPYQELRDAYPRLAELPFDSDRKLMSTINLIDDEKLMLTKGGPDVMFARCTKVLINGEVQDFTEELKAEFQKQNEAFSNKALRVLAYAYKPLAQDKEVLDLEDENDLILIGLTAMIDPPREAVYDSIAEAKKAGIRTVMITGDHKTTARAIGQDIGLFGENDIAVTGQELDAMSEQELDDNLAKISVYARVSPENKIRIVRAWQKKANVTAMTGDGVNDAPALKQANIGIAMGSGTDVAKDASSMILTDDNFVSIVNAVAVGRTVYDNIKKSIGYLFSGNLGAIITIVFALVMNWASPFTALQLLFINLVNDSVPAIALGMEKAEPNVMKKKPRPSDEGIFEGGLMASVAVRGVSIGVAAIISQYIGMQVSDELGVAMAFTTLILARSLQTFTARSNSQTILSLGLFSNKYVLGAVVFCLGLYSLTTLPFTREFFSIPANFSMHYWLLAAGLALGAVLMMEIIKALRVLVSQKKEKAKVNKVG
ncbi:cation-translocating P-type ATPase [Lactococcus garvieae]|uniref:Cation-translocating P-type ATPase n=1 Tax=Lactococcus garvieae TaxID=1363 RepID=A0AAX3NER1_9LACT|nr:cation-translocating P-type ATPase [Lactococcus garvieae]NHI69116.1 cation-translocating P-type ATPase [Lactococcus garvieae]NHJ07674.1 cation-translocating P-type ATPase [Lactococcus garvieae]WEA14515.1 cation-translocating P-type ATPase [Lactococcus garvieae]